MISVSFSKSTARGPTGLADDAWIALIFVDICSDVLPQLLEHERAPSEVQRSKLAMRDRLRDDFWRRARHELDDPGGYASLGKNLVHEVV